MSTTITAELIAEVRTQLEQLWLPVVNFDEGLYEVSRHDVRSLDRLVVQRTRWNGTTAALHRGRVLRPYITKNGRRRVVLHDAQHRRHTCFVDELIAQAFGVEGVAA